MSDFDGAEWLENQNPMPPAVRKEIAPVGPVSACIITAEKYKAQSGNWTVRVVFELGGGEYKDHQEFYSLWHTDKDVAKLANGKFTNLAVACGFKSFPENIHEFVTKTLDLGIYHKEEKWTNNEGEEVTSIKTKIGDYFSNSEPVAPSSEGVKSPPKL